jgi:hypothetical protein
VGENQPQATSQAKNWSAPREQSPGGANRSRSRPWNPPPPNYNSQGGNVINRNQSRERDPTYRNQSRERDFRAPYNNQGRSRDPSATRRWTNNDYSQNKAGNHTPAQPTSEDIQSFLVNVMKAMGGAAPGANPGLQTAPREAETRNRSGNNSRGHSDSRQSSRSAERNRNQEKVDDFSLRPWKEFLDQASDKEIINNTVFCYMCGSSGHLALRCPVYTPLEPPLAHRCKRCSLYHSVQHCKTPSTHAKNE